MQLTSRSIPTDLEPSSLVETIYSRDWLLSMLDYLITFRLLPDQQSAYRAYHSTETAVLKVLSDILLDVDSGDLAVLTYRQR